MDISPEQMSIVTGSEISGWMPIDLPTGRQKIPAWCLGAHVNWRNGYGNSPDVTLKVRGRVAKWEGQRWAKEGKKLYIARHDDGRALAYYHGGSVSLVKMSDYRNYKHTYDFGPDAVKPEPPPVVEVMATEKQDGFGGAEYWLTMEDGSDLVLRGPWHGCPPEGYVEVHMTDVEYDGYKNSTRYNKGKPWHQRSGGGGFLYISNALFLRIMAHYLPHARVALVAHSYGTYLEPYRAEWDMPKEQVYTQERMRACAKEPAGAHWRTYWDQTGGYCGNFRQPEYGYRTEVHPGDMHTQKEVDRAEALRARRWY